MVPIWQRAVVQSVLEWPLQWLDEAEPVELVLRPLVQAMVPMVEEEIPYGIPAA